MPFGMILFFGGVACLWGLWKIGFALWGAGVLVLFIFLPLCCWVDGWGLVMWLNTKLLVVNCLLRTCILFTRMCTATATGRVTWGVAF